MTRIPDRERRVSGKTRAAPRDPVRSKDLRGPPSVSGDHAESDATLIVRVERGSRDALAALFKRYGSTLFAVAVPICGRERAEAIVIQVFTDLRERPDETLDIDRLGDWLFGKARRLAVVANRDDRLPGRVDVYREEMRVSLMTSGLRSLPRVQRDVIARAYLGETYREIAAALHKTDAAVLQLIRTALDHLGSELRATPQRTGHRT